MCVCERERERERAFVCVRKRERRKTKSKSYNKRGKGRTAHPSFRPVVATTKANSPHPAMASESMSAFSQVSGLASTPVNYGV